MSKLYNFIIEEKEQCWCAAMVLSLLGYIKEDYYNLDSSTIRLNSFVKELEKRDDKVLIVKESDVNGKKAYPGHRFYDINPDSCGYKSFCDCFRKDLASTLIKIYLGGYIEEKTLPQITFGYEEDDEILIGGKNNPVKNKKLEKFSRYYVSSRDNSIIGYSPDCNYSDYKQISSRIIVKFGECCNTGEEGINSLREVVETLSSLGFTWATYNNPFTFDSLLDYISRCEADIIYLNLKNKTVQYGKEKDSNTFLKPLIINVEEVKDILRSFNVNSTLINEGDVKSSINSDKILDSENYVIFCRNKEEIVNVLEKLSELGYTWVDDTLINSDFAKNRDKVSIYVFTEEIRISYRPGICNVIIPSIESVDWVRVVKDLLKNRNSAVKLCRIKTTLRNLINDRYRWVEKDRRISKGEELKELVYIVDDNKEEIYGYCEENMYGDSILKEVNTVTKSSYSSFKDIDWSEVSLSQDISEEFIEKYKDYLDWELVSSHITLNEDTIGKYGKYLDWNVISKYQVLSPEFMEKYENKLDWEMISKHQPFVDLEKLVGSLKSMYDGCNSLGKLYQETKEEQGWFIGYITREDFDNKPSEFEIRLNQYRNYVCKVKIYWRDLTSTWPNAKKFYKEDENGESMYEEVNRVAGTGFISDRGIDWDIVSSKHRLPEWFIYKYRKELNWLIISNEQILSEVFLKVHEDEDFFYNFVISEKQPFVDPKKLNWYQKSLYRNNNHLGKLYQKTKDIGYFTAFISDVDYIDDKSINGYRFSISFKHGFTKQVKIYWKDLISPDLVSRFYELNKEDSVMLQNFPRGIVIVKHIDSGDRRVISGILDLFIRKEGFNYVGLNPGEEGIVDNIPYPGESKKDLLMLINKGDKTLTIKEEDGIVFNERGITTLSLSALYRNIKDFVEEKNLDRPKNLKILNNDKSINSFKNKKVMKNSMFDGIIEKFKSQYVPEIDNNIMISMDGNLCVKAGDEAVSVSKDSCEIVSYPVEMCFDIPGLLISKPVNMIVPGDIVKFKETYYKVLEVNPNGTIKVISFSTGTISSKKTIKDFVTGSNLVKVIINFMNGINPGLNMQQGMNPVMMAMMFQEGKDSDDMLKNMIMLSMMNPNSGMNAFTGGMMNPVMMVMMMKDSSFAGEGNDMFKMMAVMSMFNNQGGMFQTGFNNACQVNNPSIVDQPKPEKRERVSRKPRAKKVETSGEGGGAGIEM